MANETGKTELERRVDDLHSIVDLLSRDSGFKAIAAAMLYVGFLLVAIFIYFKIEQYRVFDLRLLELPIWPTIDGFPVFFESALSRLLCQLVLFPIPFALFKVLKIRSKDISEKFQCDNQNLKPWLKVGEVAFRISWIVLTTLMMLWAAGGWSSLSGLFMVNEFLFQFFIKEQRVPALSKPRTIGALLTTAVVTIISGTFLGLFSFISTWKTPEIGIGVVKLVCSAPQLVTLKLDSNERLSGWLVGRDSNFVTIRRKDEGGNYESVGLNAGKVASIVYLDKYESAEEKVHAFPDCGDDHISDYL